MSFLKSIFGDENTKKIKSIQPLVEKINSLAPSFSSLSNEDLKAKTSEYKKRLKDGETLDSLLPEAFATVREVATRTLNNVILMYS